MRARAWALIVAIVLAPTAAGVYTQLYLLMPSCPVSQTCMMAHTAPIFGCGTPCGTRDWFGSSPVYHGRIPFKLGPADGEDVVVVGRDAAEFVDIPVGAKARRVHILLTGQFSSCDDRIDARFLYADGSKETVALQVPDRFDGCEGIVTFFGQSLSWFVYVRSLANPSPSLSIDKLELAGKGRGVGPQAVVIAVTLEGGDGDDGEGSCTELLGDGHWSVGAGEQRSAVVYAYYGNWTAGSVSSGSPGPASPQPTVSIELEEPQAIVHPSYWWGSSRLVAWSKLPGADDATFKRFLKVGCSLDWADGATIAKVDGGAAVKASSGSRWAELRLSADGRKATLKLDDGRTREMVSVRSGSDLLIYNAPFSHRRRMTMTSPEELTDHRVKVVLDTASPIAAGRMKGDCSDLRFLSGEGVQLGHLYAAGCGSQATTFWVTVPSIPATQGGVLKCCGDDAAEHLRSKSCESGCTSDPDKSACCDYAYDCVFDECERQTSQSGCAGAGCTWDAGRRSPCLGRTRCYGHGTELDLLGDGTTEYCEWGDWKEYFEVVFAPGRRPEPKPVLQHIKRGGGTVFLKVRNQMGATTSVKNVRFSTSGMLQDMQPVFYASEPPSVWDESKATLKEMTGLRSMTVTLRYAVPSFDDLLVNAFKGGIVVTADAISPVYLPVTIYVNYTDVKVGELAQRDIRAMMQLAIGAVKVSGGYTGL